MNFHFSQTPRDLKKEFEGDDGSAAFRRSRVGDGRARVCVKFRRAWLHAQAQGSNHSLSDPIGNAPIEEKGPTLFKSSTQSLAIVKGNCYSETVNAALISEFHTAKGRV